ncbi:hypothetical protein [Eggerthella guodeyinii]|nr:hypothetical protein [Eggerthella guodeyinii]
MAEKGSIMIVILQKFSAAVLAAVLALLLVGCNGQPNGNEAQRGDGARQAMLEIFDATYQYGALEIPVSSEWAEEFSSDEAGIAFIPGENQCVRLDRYDVGNELRSNSVDDILFEAAEDRFPLQATNGTLKGTPIIKEGCDARSFYATTKIENGELVERGEIYVSGSTLYIVELSYFFGEESELEGIADDLLASVSMQEEASNETQIGTQDDSKAPPSDVLKEDENSKGICLKEAVEISDGIFILRDGMCYSATTAFASGKDGGLLIGGRAEGSVPILMMSEGDSLITTRDKESYAVLPFCEEGYTEDPSTNILVYDEIDGVDPNSLNLSNKQSAAEEILSKKGIAYKDFHWTAPEPTEFSVGRYVGTKWSEDIVEIKNKYYMPDWSVEKTILPVSKTRDGYFTIETDSLLPGDYMINIYTSVSGVAHMFRLVVA